MMLNTPLVKILGFSWLAFLATGLLISRLLPMPEMTVLIDRSYCPAHQWQQVSQAYTALYRQHQWRQLSVQRVVLFSQLGEEVFSVPPPPTTIQRLSTYGHRDVQQREKLRKAYPKAQVLNCSS